MSGDVWEHRGATPSGLRLPEHVTLPRHVCQTPVTYITTTDVLMSPMDWAVIASLPAEARHSMIVYDLVAESLRKVVRIVRADVRSCCGSERKNLRAPTVAYV